jgi:hypothetical protein
VKGRQRRRGRSSSGGKGATPPPPPLTGEDRHGPAPPPHETAQATAEATLHRPLRRRAAALGAVATVSVAVWGAYTGTTTWLDDRRVDVRLMGGSIDVGIINELFETSGQVAVVNESRRGVTLTRGEVRVGDRRAGTVNEVIPGGAPRSEVRPQASAQPLPMTVSADTSQSIGLLWDIDPDDEGVRRQLIDAAKKPIELTLRLRFEPGGWREIDIRSGFISGPQLALANHLVKLRVEHRAVVGMRLPWEGQHSRAIGRLRLWRGDAGRPTRTVTRPVDDGDDIRFPLPSLRPGTYPWAMTIDGQLVRVGQFSTPCRRLREGSLELEELDVCGSHA